MLFEKKPKRKTKQETNKKKERKYEERNELFDKSNLRIDCSQIGHVYHM